jgi:hypothetical protein
LAKASKDAKNNARLTKNRQNAPEASRRAVFPQKMASAARRGSRKVFDAMDIRGVFGALFPPKALEPL